MSRPLTTVGLRAACGAVLGLAAFSCVFAAPAADARRDDTSITIYSSAAPGAIPPEMYRPTPGSGVPSGMAVPGYAMVRQDRPMNLTAGKGTVRFIDVAAYIDPTTVQFSSLTDPANTRVLEQNFQFDLVGTDKLLSKYIDREITLERLVGDHVTTLTGTLLSARGGLVIRGKDDQLYAVNNYAAIRFGELPGGLITRPTLVWDVQAQKGGEHKTRVAYQTGGITWWADYNLVFSEGANANSGFLDVGAWVSIINQSGATYPEAKLKLIAGDVHRAEPQSDTFRREKAMAMATALEAPGGFQQKDFFEFHLYTLGRRTTLPDNSTKQIELFDSAKRVPARKVLLYYGAPVYYTPYEPLVDRNLGSQSNKKVDVYLEFRNDEKAGLGIPLPAGRMRISQLDKADASLEFIGEDVIDHTPRDEDVRVKLGSAFDVVGERKQVDFRVDSAAKWLEEEFEIRLRNHKKEAVDVIVKENLYRWTNWQVLRSSHKYEKDDARTILLPVRVEKDGEAVVRYRVRYTW